MQWIGPYEVVDEIARGAMGVVLRARGPEGKPVALKLMLKARDADAEDFARFRQEAEIVSRLEHPGIVRLLDLGTSPHGPYLALQLVPGRSLKEVLRTQGTLPEEKAARVALGLTTALAHAHERGVLHRDVKPGNVLIDEHGAPRLTDFGLGRLLTSQRMTQSGDLLGTPAYMPPEQALGKRGSVGPHSDVYGVGATLYHMLTGRPPVDGASLEEVLERAINQPPAEVSELAPDVDPRLAAICMRCLEKEPGDRYLSVSALAEDLRAFLRGDSVTLRVQAAPPTLWIALAAATVLLAVLAGLLAATLRPDRAAPAPPTPVAAAPTPTPTPAPDPKAAALARAEELVALDDPGAEAALLTLDELAPDDPQVALLWADHHQRAGRPQRSLEALKTAEERGARDAVADRLLALYPNRDLRELVWSTLVPGDPLERSALLAARATLEPGLELAPSLARLDELAERIRPALNGLEGDLRLRALVRACKTEAVRGTSRSDYANPRNSCLHCVLERRVGIQITCAMVLIALGERLDVPLDGVCFPGRFLARTRTSPALYVDAFQGVVQTEAELRADFARDTRAAVPEESLRPAPRQLIMIRLLHFLAGRQEQLRDREGMLRTFRALDALTPRGDRDELTRRAFGGF